MLKCIIYKKQGTFRSLPNWVIDALLINIQAFHKQRRDRKYQILFMILCKRTVIKSNHGMRNAEHLNIY